MKKTEKEKFLDILRERVNQALTEIAPEEIQLNITRDYIRKALKGPIDSSAFFHPLCVASI